MKGARIVIETLIEQGTEYVFGYPGGYVIDLFDELYSVQDKIVQILTCHEQGAAHAADGYARATGRVGVVMATSGPGATNLVTGLATAYMDSVPMVAITGNVTLGALGRDSFQEVDITGVTLPVTKHNYIVKDIAALADTLREAFSIARSGRPGPVLVDIPKDIMQSEFPFASVPPVYTAHTPPKESELSAAVRAIDAAEKPLIYYGGGAVISGAAAELLTFAEKLDCPVASSMMGLGAFPASHPLYAGMAGMHGHAGVTKALQECDLVIALGARYSDRVAGDREGFARQAKKLHIDIDNAELNKNVRSDFTVTADLKTALAALNTRVKPLKRPEWRTRVTTLLERYAPRISDKEVSPQLLLKALQGLTRPEDIIATDVGQHQMWTVQTYRFERPRTLLTSGGLGTMGFGMGAAIGAAIGTKRRVVLITGDGSFHMNMNELITASKLNLPVKVIIFNNNVLGMVHQWQKLFYGNRYSGTTLDRPLDYVKYAESAGVKGFVIRRNAEAAEVLAAALKVKGPALIDCRIDPEENVLPMIPAGKGAEALILSIDC
jgi:acetolactate synthase-1/2/3 large subunit